MAIAYGVSEVMMEHHFATDLYPRRLHDLEAQFADLAAHIPDSPEKQALSVLHGITQELWRNLGRSGTATRTPEPGSRRSG